MFQHTRSSRVRAAEVAIILGIGKSTVWRWVKEKPDFPQPRRDGRRCTFWLRSEVEAYATGSSHEQEAACGV
ncbi:MAG: AlpA family phage regulatory protein [Mailhella sp.]|nr:AlpA family phage regulatory protein [Mailhella sp.]